MVKIAVLVSGGGTNLQALIDAQRQGILHSGEISLVVSSRKGAYALERAAKAGIEAVVLAKRAYPSKEEYDQALVEILKEHHIDVVVLAGFLCIFGKTVIEAYPDRILNVHPSLIPAFCGDGFYGLHVHEAALKKGVKVTGATVHLVNEVTDGGKILMQKAVEVHEDDTPESLQKRVMEQAEWVLLPRATEMICAQYQKTKE